MTTQTVIYKMGAMNIHAMVNKKGIVENSSLKVKEYLQNLSHEYMHIAYDDAVILIECEAQRHYLKPWEKITEEQWWHYLEVLPPEKWLTMGDVEIFRMSEYLTGNITSHYARYKDEYFMAMRRTSDSYVDLSCEVIETSTKLRARNRG